jgi:hypothetical protein
MPGSFAVSSHIGVGPFRFGMTRHQVRTALPVRFEALARTPGAEVADHFPTIPAFAYYSKEGTLEAVEFAPGATVSLGDFDLTRQVISEAIEHLARADPRLKREPSGCISKACGIGLWSEGGLGAPPQSVIVFARGYYD